MPVRVTTGARLHFGFCNLSLGHERLYGGLGVAIDEPRLVVEAGRADGLDCADPSARAYAEQVVDLLDLPGAAVTVREALPRHRGLGSGTQLALAVLTAVARAHGRDPDVAAHAPALGRGGRSGVGVATFRGGGAVLDAGHPAERFTSERPPEGTWRVPPVVSRLDVPEDWRFVLALPALDAGRSDAEEDASMRSSVASADPEAADRIAGTVVRRVLPGLATDDREAFGAGVEEIGRLNGAWYADEQGGLYRPSVGPVVEALSGSDAVAGAGQSSWGPAVYGVTHAGAADAARAAAERGLAAAGVAGEVRVVAARNRGATVEDAGERP